MYYLFGIPNCDTVKKARNFLDGKQVDYQFVDFKKTPPSANEIALWQKSFGELPINKQGQTYKKHAQAFEELSDGEKISFIRENPSMIKRPILQRGSDVLSFGFDEAQYLKRVGL